MLFSALLLPVKQGASHRRMALIKHFLKRIQKKERKGSRLVKAVKVIQVFAEIFFYKLFLKAKIFNQKTLSALPCPLMSWLSFFRFSFKKCAALWLFLKAKQHLNETLI